MDFDTIPARRPSKRPVANKNLAYLSISPTESVISAIPRETSGFALFSHTIKNEIENKNIDPERIRKSIQDYITMLKDIRSNLIQTYKKSQENMTASYVRPATPYRRIPPVRRNLTRTLSVQFNGSSQQNVHSTSKPLKRANSVSGIKEPSRQLSPSSLWQMTNKFFSVAPTNKTLSSVLSPAEPPDINIPLGPHYSIHINQALRQKYKSDNIQIKVPSVLGSPSTNSDLSPTVIFHRLLSSIIQIYDPVNSPIIKPRSNSVVESFREDPDVIFPCIAPGTSKYSSFSFEEKLILEIQSLELPPNRGELALTDNEVMQEIIDRHKELAQLMKQNNEKRKMLSDILASKESTLEALRERVTKWNLSFDKSDQSVKKISSRPKSRGKKQ